MKLEWISLLDETFAFLLQNNTKSIGYIPIFRASIKQYVHTDCMRLNKNYRNIPIFKASIEQYAQYWLGRKGLDNQSYVMEVTIMGN